jgi:ABC-type taurine transport system ATPase subunit
MSPQLRQILVHAKQLNHAEQLLLITHMVNHALPLEPEVTMPVASELIAPEPPPALVAELLEDPQYAEFRDEIALYKQNLAPHHTPQLGLD